MGIFSGKASATPSTDSVYIYIYIYQLLAFYGLRIRCVLLAEIQQLGSGQCWSTAGIIVKRVNRAMVEVRLFSPIESRIAEMNDTDVND